MAIKVGNLVKGWGIEKLKKTVKVMRMFGCDHGPWQKMLSALKLYVLCGCIPVKVIKTSLLDDYFVYSI